MNTFPDVGSQFLQERLGVNAVARVAARLGLIWRENQVKDLGIDGQLEYVTREGNATGRLVAVQVKSGESYFRHEEEDCWRFYPEEKHRLYWERFPIPVILVLCRPTTDQLAWIDVRQVLRSLSQPTAVRVPKKSSLEASTREELFATSGVTDEEFAGDLKKVAMLMIAKHAQATGLPLSYFELFVHGLTNTARSLYFGMDLAMEVAEGSLDLENPGRGISIGPQDHEFLFEYVKFLVSQDLATVDFSDCLIDWEDHQLQPHFVAPLTSRGRALVQMIGSTEDRLRSTGLLSSQSPWRVAQERFFQMIFVDTGERIPLVKRFETLINGTPGVLDD
jgi:hypothetical protein